MRTDESSPVQTRIDISEQEWKDIRKEAVDRDMTSSKWLGVLVRAGRECIIDKEREGVA